MKRTYTVFGIALLLSLFLFSINAWADTYISFSSNRTGNSDIYVMDIFGNNLRNLTNHPAYDGDVTWSPDGDSFAFVSNRDGHRDIYIMDVDGVETRRLTDHPEEATQPDWSPDGHWIVFTSDRASRENYDIYKINVNGRNLQRLTNNRAYDMSPVWSPDGKQIAFSSHRDGSWGIFVMNANGKHLRRVTQAEVGGISPSWSPDGKQIAYPILRCQNPLALAGGCRHRLLYCAKKTLDFWSKILYDITIYGLGYATFSLTLIDPNHPFAGVA